MINQDNQIFLGKRIHQDGWQFPQGGVDQDESAEEALYRELYEEVGLLPEHVEMIAQTRQWLTYRLPKQFIRGHSLPLCIGQRQKWFLLRLIAPDSAIHFTHEKKPEFDDWSWVNYWYPLCKVIAFKREVYRKALAEFSSIVNGRYLKRGHLDPIDNN